MKEVENYRYASVPMEIRLKLFFAQLFLLISSVSTGQSQKCEKSMKPFMKERGNPLSEGNRVPHSCQA